MPLLGWAGRSQGASSTKSAALAPILARGPNVVGPGNLTRSSWFHYQITTTATIR